jgi:hypothetical protein
MEGVQAVGGQPYPFLAGQLDPGRGRLGVSALPAPAAGNNRARSKNVFRPISSRNNYFIPNLF